MKIGWNFIQFFNFWRFWFEKHLPSLSKDNWFFLVFCLNIVLHDTGLFHDTFIIFYNVVPTQMKAIRQYHLPLFTKYELDIMLRKVVRYLVLEWTILSWGGVYIEIFWNTERVIVFLDIHSYYFSQSLPWQKVLHNIGSPPVALDVLNLLFFP